MIPWQTWDPARVDLGLVSGVPEVLEVLVSGDLGDLVSGVMEDLVSGVVEEEDGDLGGDQDLQVHQAG